MFYGGIHIHSDTSFIGMCVYRFRHGLSRTCALYQIHIIAEESRIFSSLTLGEEALMNICLTYLRGRCNDTNVVDFSKFCISSTVYILYYKGYSICKEQH